MVTLDAVGLEHLDPADLVGVDIAAVFDRPEWQRDAVCADYPRDPFFSMSPIVLDRANAVRRLSRARRVPRTRWRTTPLAYGWNYYWGEAAAEGFASLLAVAEKKFHARFHGTTPYGAHRVCRAG